MIRIILTFLMLLSCIFATNYTTSSKAMAIDQKSACQKALDSAREDALAQAGTLVISSFSNSTNIDGDKYSSIKNKELSSVSIGVAKLISKEEIVEVTKDYQFYCAVNATFNIDEDDMKKAIDKYIASSDKKTNKSIIIIKATGYSEEGQSRYQALKVATIDAKRNLLDEIKGSKLFSNIQSQNGQLVADKVINTIESTIRFVKVLSSKYDSENRSAEVVVGITEEDLIKNIEEWKNNQ